KTSPQPHGREPVDGVHSRHRASSAWAPPPTPHMVETYGTTLSAAWATASSTAPTTHSSPASSSAVRPRTPAPRARPRTEALRRVVAVRSAGASAVEPPARAATPPRHKPAPQHRQNE